MAQLLPLLSVVLGCFTFRLLALMEKPPRPPRLALRVSTQTRAWWCLVGLGPSVRGGGGVKEVRRGAALAADGEVVEALRLSDVLRFEGRAGVEIGLLSPTRFGGVRVRERLAIRPSTVFCSPALPTRCLCWRGLKGITVACVRLVDSFGAVPPKTFLSTGMVTGAVWLFLKCFW